MVNKKSSLRKTLEYFDNLLKQIDIFGEPITLRLNRDFGNVTTTAGGLMTILVLSTLTIYLYQQSIFLIENTKGVEFTVNDHFTPVGDEFKVNLGDYEDSFNVFF